MVDAQQTKTDQTFTDFGVSEPITRALAEKGVVNPFPIQALTLPVSMKRGDIIGQAKTGTGKTYGFALPIIERAKAPSNPNYSDLPFPGLPQALIILPTRELAKQVAQDVIQAAKYTGLRIVEIYGGTDFDPQLKALQEGVDIVVGTPGRLIDLLKRRELKLNQVDAVVLDEADELLDLGFLPDVETLLSRVPATRHTMLFSATMPAAVVALARRFMEHPTHIRVQDPTDDSKTVSSVRQLIYRIHPMNKEEVLIRILQARDRGRVIIFSRTKRSAQHVCEVLQDRGFRAAPLHGDLNQGARERALRRFRDGEIDVLVATDVAARGIDVDDITHVVNYECPDDSTEYLHRIGRTGRAGAEGTAITFVDWEDTTKWRVINRELNLDRPDPVETYHTSEHLYTDLDIDPNVTNRIGPSTRKRSDREDQLQHGSRGGSRNAYRSRSSKGAKGGREHGENSSEQHGKRNNRRSRQRRNNSRARRSPE
ncbi:MAG: DEAD/DEAH box helicase [Varibaculum sp.]|nr:DEAD/DEAH box helicase [Varibaculum sp.]